MVRPSQSRRASFLENLFLRDSKIELSESFLNIDETVLIIMTDYFSYYNKIQFSIFAYFKQKN